MATLARREARILPGFSLSMGITLLFLCLIVLLPLTGLFWQLAQLGPGDYLRVMGSERVLAALAEAKSRTGKGRPVVILLRTDMGQGVDFMMGTHKWHGVAPNDEQAARALEQLEETLGDY